MPAPKDPVKRALWIERMSKVRLGKKKPPASEEQKRKQSEAMKGKFAGEKNPMYGVHLIGEKNPFYGKKHSEEAIKKNREAHLGKPSWNKGVPSTWTKGLPRPEEVKEKISIGNTGKPKSEEHKEKVRKTKLATTPTGKDSIHWKGGITKLNLHIRTLPRYKLVCEQAMKDADYTDAFTGRRGGVLACHHKIPQNIIISMNNIKTIDEAKRCPLLFDKNNIIIMLSSAHDKFHNLYGDDKNIYKLTDEQIQELYQQ
jgi:hypothetical protein